MKKIVAVVLSILALQTIQAGILDVGLSALKKAKIYGQEGNNLGFELKNKKPHTIWFGVREIEGDKDTIGHNKLIALEPGKSFGLKSDITKTTEIAIFNGVPHYWNDKTREFLIQNLFNKGGYESLNKQARPLIAAPDQVWLITPDNKTLFLTYDAEGKLRPQTGLAGGKLGKTDTGYSLTEPGNVAASNIHLLYPAK